MDITLIGSGAGYNLYALIINGICQVIEYIDGLDPLSQKQITSLFKLITDTGVPHNIEKYRNIGDKIYELKTRGGVRILCFTGGAGLLRSLILTHAFHKRDHRILAREKQKALNWKEQFFQESIKIVNFNRRRENGIG